MLTSRCYFFGTFNPIHLGHLIMAESARAQFGFDNILFIPAFVPPHRQHDSDMADFHHRVAMVEAAIEGNPAFFVSAVEQTLPPPSYTIQTLRYFHPDFDISTSRVPIIIGADALAGLHTWHDAITLKNRVRFILAPRESLSREPQSLSDDLDTVTLDMPLIGISATDIRCRIRNRKSIRYAVPDGVLSYITKHRLYD